MTEGFSTEWFCTKCHRVFSTGKGYENPCKSCGGEVVEFDLSEHGRKLIGNSNSWISVWREWKDHPLLEGAAREVYRDGNYGASMVLNAFVELLLDKIENLEAENEWLREKEND